jgi:hypothetical protein
VQNGHSRNPSGFDMAARSPPNQSNTKHVPCKFFRQGACQAGPACPFLHSTDAAIDYAPCKYFTKVRLVTGSILVPIPPSRSGGYKQFSSFLILDFESMLLTGLFIAQLGQLQVRSQVRAGAYPS